MSLSQKLPSVFMTMQVILCLFAQLGCDFQERLDVSSAIQQLKNIRTAQEAYREKHGRYGDLDELVSAELLDSDLADGIDKNYRFTIVRGDKDYRVIAMTTRNVAPDSPGIALFLDESGVIRARDRAKEPPNRHSDPIQNQ